VAQAFYQPVTLHDTQNTGQNTEGNCVSMHYYL